MAKYVIPDKHQLMQCPYHPEHQVEAYRFQRHLQRCKKNNPDKDFVHCPFNHSHMMPRVNLQHHKANCPDKARLDLDLQADQATPRISTWEIPKSTESWDDDVTTIPHLQALGDEGFTPVLPSQKRPMGRSHSEIDSWIRGISGGIIDDHDEVMENPWGNESDRPDLRLPHSAPRALQVKTPSVGSESANNPRSVNYALAMAGIGRGGQNKNAPAAKDVDTECFKSIGRGRGRHPGSLSNGPSQSRPSPNSVKNTHLPGQGQKVVPVGRGVRCVTSTPQTKSYGSSSPVRAMSGTTSPASSTDGSSQIGQGRGIGHLMQVPTSPNMPAPPGIGRGVNRANRAANGFKPQEAAQFIIPNINQSRKKCVDGTQGQVDTERRP